MAIAYCLQHDAGIRNETLDVIQDRFSRQNDARIDIEYSRSRTVRLDHAVFYTIRA
jgi:hypothetical protein